MKQDIANTQTGQIILERTEINEINIQSDKIENFIRTSSLSAHQKPFVTADFKTSLPHDVSTFQPSFKIRNRSQSSLNCTEYELKLKIEKPISRSDSINSSFNALDLTINEKSLDPSLFEKENSNSRASSITGQTKYIESEPQSLSIEPVSAVSRHSSAKSSTQGSSTSWKKSFMEILEGKMNQF